jgi:uncharacterized protein (DUF1778 family)
VVSERRKVVARKLTDTVKLQVRLSERLRRLLERAAEHNGHSMNTEIVDRLDVSFQREALEKEIGGVMEQAVHEAATKAARETARMLVQQLSQTGLIPRPNEDDSEGKQ